MYQNSWVTNEIKTRRKFLVLKDFINKMKE